MGILIAIIIGGLAGWVASLILDRDNEQGIIVNVVVGIIGAFIANLFISPLIGVSADITVLSLSSFLMSLAGAIVLLAVINLVTRKRIK